MLKKYSIWNYDFKLIFMVLILSTFGIITIGSAEESLQSRQLLGVVAGVFLMIVISFIDYSLLLKLNWIMYFGNLALLVCVWRFGDNTKGATRWLVIGSLRFQPSEIAKIVLILFLAQFIMKHREKLNTVVILASCVILTAIPWVFVNRQPDLSTSIVLLVLFCVIMFAGGISIKLVLAILPVAVAAVALVIAIALQPDNELISNNQRNRVLAFVNPEEYATTFAYQQLNSVKAIASGQLEGKGYKNNEITSVKNGNFISEAETDFIFSVIGEEFGFKGSVAVIVLIVAISLECISVARKAKDVAGRVIAASMGGLIAFQGFINIGVATFILPNTGLTLPFVSYGLTSLISLYIGMGFVLNVRLQGGKARNKAASNEL